MASMEAEIAKILTALAEYYDKTLTAGQLAMYVEDLIMLSPVELLRAVQEYRTKPENNWFPLPAKLVALARPQPTDEQNAIDAITRIIQAVAKFGSYRNEDAKNFIGEMGWFVVQREGGWQNVCALLNEDNIGMLRAQWREMAKAFSSRSRAGTLGLAPELPVQKSKPEQLSSFGNLIGRIEQKSKGGK